MSGEWKDKAAHGSYLDSILHYGPDLAAGSPQEARSESCPTSLTGEEGSAANESPGAEFWDESSCAHEWAYTGTAYGGDDPRWSGEGRCYCAICGADGDA